MTKETLNHAPVALPPTSVDFQKLQEQLEPLTKIDDEQKRDQAARKAIVSSLSEGAFKAEETDLSMRPDQKRVDVKREDLGVTESVRVFDAKSPAAKDAAKDAEEDAERLDQQQRTLAERAQPSGTTTDTGAAAAGSDSK